MPVLLHLKMYAIKIEPFFPSNFLTDVGKRDWNAVISGPRSHLNLRWEKFIQLSMSFCCRSDNLFPVTLIFLSYNNTFQCFLAPLFTSSTVIKCLLSRLSSCNATVSQLVKNDLTKLHNTIALQHHCVTMSQRHSVTES